MKPLLTTGWFDTNDEFDEHRRHVKNKMNKSVHQNGSDSGGMNVYKNYKNMGGRQGNLIFGGPDAFDVTSKGGLDELRGNVDGT